MPTTCFSLHTLSNRTTGRNHQKRTIDQNLTKQTPYKNRIIVIPIFPRNYSSAPTVSTIVRNHHQRPPPPQPISTPGHDVLEIGDEMEGVTVFVWKSVIRLKGKRNSKINLLRERIEKEKTNNPYSQERNLQPTLPSPYPLTPNNAPPTPPPPLPPPQHLHLHRTPPPPHPPPLHHPLHHPLHPSPHHHL